MSEQLGFPKKKYNRKNPKPPRNPIPTINDRCAICGKPYAELHEIYFGDGKRRLSQIHGAQIRLCMCHHRVGKEAVHNNHEFDLRLKRDWQAEFEKTHTKKEFMSIFGKSYL